MKCILWRHLQIPEQEKTNWTLFSMETPWEVLLVCSPLPSQTWRYKQRGCWGRALLALMDRIPSSSLVWTLTRLSVNKLKVQQCHLPVFLVLCGLLKEVCRMGGATSFCLKECKWVGWIYTYHGERRGVEKLKISCIRHVAGVGGSLTTRHLCSLWHRVWIVHPGLFVLVFFLAEQAKVQQCPMLETWEIVTPKERETTSSLCLSVFSPQLVWWLMDGKQLELEAEP